MSTLQEQLRASLEPLIEVLSKAAPAASTVPASDPDADDDEAEFMARLEAEMEEEFRERLIQEKKKVATTAEKFTKNIKQWQDNIRLEVDELKQRPTTVIQAAPIQIIEPKVEPKPSALDWTLEVTGRENGLMRTVVATAEGREVQFTIRRTPDGFPKAIDVRMAA